MSEIRSIAETPVVRLDREPTPPSRRDFSGESVRRGDDRVEVSDVARLLNRLTSDEVRDDLVARVRGEIERGEYETPEKLDAALDAAVDDLAF